MIAALYVQANGSYSKLPGVDLWHKRRNALDYWGPSPVVAHPPCGPWGRYSHRCISDDLNVALVAVCQVQRFAGVLEHPAHSKLWKVAGLPMPGEFPDQHGGVTVEVDQACWGHRARKRSWLYVVRCEHDLTTLRSVHVPPDSQLRPLEWLSKLERERTPPAFARLLLDIAATAR